MTKESENFLTKNLLSVGLVIIAVGILLTLLAPFIFTQFSWAYDLSDKGPIGDSIAGTTAPIIGLVSSILIFLSLYAQIRANRIVLDEFEEERKRFQESNEHRKVENEEADRRFKEQQRNEKFSLVIRMLSDRNKDIDSLAILDPSSNSVRSGNEAVRIVISKLGAGETPKESWILVRILESITDLLKNIHIFDLEKEQLLIIFAQIGATISKIEAYIDRLNLEELEESTHATVLGFIKGRLKKIESLGAEYETDRLPKP